MLNHEAYTQHEHLPHDEQMNANVQFVQHLTQVSVVQANSDSTIETIPVHQDFLIGRLGCLVSLPFVCLLQVSPLKMDPIHCLAIPKEVAEILFQNNYSL
jgi:hypothetical protein